MKIRSIKILIVFLVSLVSFSCMSQKYHGTLTWDDYIHKFRNEPYILRLDVEDSSLLYYGAFHKVDPEDPQFIDIEQRWADFRPTYVYCEGLIWPVEKSRTEAILRYGEQGLITYLAARDGIPIRCIDPSLSDQILYLKNFFRPHYIKIYFILRQATINRFLKRDTNDLDYVNKFLSVIGSINGFESSPTTRLEFESMVSKCFAELDKWQNIPNSYFHSSESGKFLADIHQKLNGYRDRIMIKKVRAALNVGNRVFAVVGQSHVVKQEPVLRSKD